VAFGFSGCCADVPRCQRPLPRRGVTCGSTYITWRIDFFCNQAAAVNDLSPLNTWRPKSRRHFRQTSPTFLICCIFSEARLCASGKTSMCCGCPEIRSPGQSRFIYQCGLRVRTAKDFRKRHRTFIDTSPRSNEPIGRNVGDTVTSYLS
jgi:hypothetical protein